MTLIYSDKNEKKRDGINVMNDCQNGFLSELRCIKAIAFLIKTHLYDFIPISSQISLQTSICRDDQSVVHLFFFFFKMATHVEHSEESDSQLSEDLIAFRMFILQM